MNSKGLTGSLLNIMLAVTIFILALALAPGLTSSINNIRNQTDTGEQGIGLNCVLVNGSSNNTLSNFQEATCVATDLISPLFILALIGIAGAIIGAKIVLT